MPVVVTCYFAYSCSEANRTV